MSALYEIRLYDHSGVQRLTFNTWEGMNFSQRVNAPWNHQIRLGYNIDSEAGRYIIDTVKRDWIVEIKRRDLILDRVDTVYEGFNRTIVDQLTQHGKVILTLYGVGYTQLLLRRQVLPPANQKHSKKTGVAETIMKEYVAESMISPVDTARIISGFSNQPDSSLGAIATYSARYNRLLTVISRLAEQGGVDFGVVGVPGRKWEWEFAVRSLWGTDRRNGVQDINPTIFDVRYGNMEIPILSDNAGDEVNYVYVGGQDQGVLRQIAEFSNDAAISESPINRHEDFIDARQQDDLAGMTVVAESELKARGATSTLTFNIRQTNGTRWLSNWELGDLVTAYYRGRRFDKKIVEVDVSVSSQSGELDASENISIEMEEYTG